MDITQHEQRMHDNYKAIEAENYHLKNQLHRKNKQLKGLKSEYAALLSKYKKLTDNKKPRYNNGKRGK